MTMVEIKGHKAENSKIIVNIWITKIPRKLTRFQGKTTRLKYNGILVPVRPSFGLRRRSSKT